MLVLLCGALHSYRLSSVFLGQPGSPPFLKNDKSSRPTGRLPATNGSPCSAVRREMCVLVCVDTNTWDDLPGAVITRILS